MIVTPVFSSPRISAQLIGAAPRYFGRSDGWMLMQPSPRSVDDLPGEDLPEGRDDDEIRCELTEGFEKVRGSDLFRLEDRQAETVGQRA